MLKLVLLLSMFLSMPSPADTQSFSLDAGEAVVFLQLEDLNGMNVDSLVFNHIDSKKKFVTKMPLFSKYKNSFEEL